MLGCHADVILDTVSGLYNDFEGGLPFMSEGAEDWLPSEISSLLIARENQLSDANLLDWLKSGFRENWRSCHKA